MLKNQQLIEDVISDRNAKYDPVREFATRNKASPINIWSQFELFTGKAFLKIYNCNIDGLKLKFRFVTLTINGRHKPR